MFDAVGPFNDREFQNWKRNWHFPSGDGSDGLAYDPREKVAVTSNGEGNMSFVVKR